jgi:hypothetical protein
MTPRGEGLEPAAILTHTWLPVMSNLSLRNGVPLPVSMYRRLRLLQSLSLPVMSSPALVLMSFSSSSCGGALAQVRRHGAAGLHPEEPPPEVYTMI